MLGEKLQSPGVIGIESEQVRDLRMVARSFASYPPRNHRVNGVTEPLATDASAGLVRERGVARAKRAVAEFAQGDHVGSSP